MFDRLFKFLSIKTRPFAFLALAIFRMILTVWRINCIFLEVEIESLF